MSTIDDLAAIIGEEQARELFGQAVELTVKLENAGVECKTDGEGVADAGSVAADGGEAEAEAGAKAEGGSEDGAGMELDDLVSKAVVDAVSEVASTFQRVVEGLTEAFEKVRADVEPLTQQIAALGPVVQELEREVEAVKAAQEKQAREVEAVQKELGQARLVFRSDELNAMRPSRLESAERVTPTRAELEQLASEVLDNNEAAVRYWRERRQRLGY